MSHQLRPWIVTELLKIIESAGEVEGSVCQIKILPGLKTPNVHEQFYEATISDREVIVPIRIPAAVAKSTEEDDDIGTPLDELAKKGLLYVTIAELAVHVDLITSRRILTARTFQLMGNRGEPLVGNPQPYEKHSELLRWFVIERDQAKTQAEEASFITSESSKRTQLLAATLLSDIRPMEMKSKRSFGKLKLAWELAANYCPTDSSNYKLAPSIILPSSVLTAEPLSQQDTDMEDSEDEHVDEELKQVVEDEHDDDIPLSSWEPTPQKPRRPQREEEDDKADITLDDDHMHPSSPLAFRTKKRDRDSRSNVPAALQLPPPATLKPSNSIRGLNSTPVPPRKPQILVPNSDPSSQSQPPTQERLDSSQDQHQEQHPASELPVKAEVESRGLKTRASKSEVPSDSESNLSVVSPVRSQSRHDVEEVESGLSPLKLVESQSRTIQSSSDEEEEGEERNVASPRYDSRTKTSHNARSHSHRSAIQPKQKSTSHQPQPTTQPSLKHSTQSSNTSNSLPSKEDDDSQNKYPSPVSQIPSPPPSLLDISSQEVDDKGADGDEDERKLQLSLPETPIKTSRRKTASFASSRVKSVLESPVNPFPKTQASTTTPSGPSQAAKTTPINGLVRSGKGRPELFGKSSAIDRRLGGSKPKRSVAAKSTGKGKSKAESGDEGSSTLEEEDEVEVAAQASAPPKSRQKAPAALVSNEPPQREVTRRSRILLESDEEVAEPAAKKGRRTTRTPAPKRDSDAAPLRKAHLAEHTQTTDHDHSPQTSLATRLTARVSSAESRRRKLEVTFAPAPQESADPSSPIAEHNVLPTSSQFSLHFSQQPHSTPHPRAPYPSHTHRTVSTDVTSIRSQPRLSTGALKFDPIPPIPLPLSTRTSRASFLSRAPISDLPDSISPLIRQNDTRQPSASALLPMPAPIVSGKRKRFDEEQAQGETIVDDKKEAKKPRLEDDVFCVPSLEQLQKQYRRRSSLTSRPGATSIARSPSFHPQEVANTRTSSNGNVVDGSSRRLSSSSVNGSHQQRAGANALPRKSSSKLVESRATTSSTRATQGSRSSYPSSSHQATDAIIARQPRASEPVPPRPTPHALAQIPPRHSYSGSLAPKNKAALPTISRPSVLQQSGGSHTSFRPAEAHPAFLTTRDLHDVIRRVENWRSKTRTSIAR